MKKIINRNTLKKLSKQVNCEPLPLDELDEFCEKNQHYSERELTAKIWKDFGMFNYDSRCQVITFFTTKGGVLKTTLAYNFARIAALSGKRTLVVGLDMQCDITNSLQQPSRDEPESLKTALEQLQSVRGLKSFFSKECQLEQVILQSDLQNLHYIPESPDLTLLSDSISLINRREFWLRDKVVNTLLPKFDLIIFDCSPNWNRLTTNALCASDVLISPVECKINNFKNIEVFQELVGEIKADLDLGFQTCFVPTRFSNSKKLSSEIYHWYLENLPGCIEGFIRESIESEEAIALQKSVVEYHPNSKVSKDMLNIVYKLSNELKNKNLFCRPVPPNYQKYRLAQGDAIYGAHS